MDWCIFPALTAGPLGLFDQGDPNVTTLLGDTPGPLGMNDWNDPTIGCFHNALAKLSWDTDDDFMASGVGGAPWPIEPPVNRIARGANGSSVTGNAAALGVNSSGSAGAVTDFTAVANTRAGYPSQGLTEYEGKNVAYTTSFNSATGYWEQSTGDGFLINAISWAPRDAAPPTPRSAMSISMTMQSESLYTAGRSFLGDAYRVAVHEVLNPDNTWAIRTGYGLSALVVAIPGFLNDLSRDLYNSANDLYVGGKGMSAGLTNRDPYGFSDGLMRFSMGLLSAAGGAAILEKGIVSNRLATKYVASNHAARAPTRPASLPASLAATEDAQQSRIGLATEETGTVAGNGVDGGNLSIAEGTLAEVWNLKPIERGNAIESHLAQTAYRDWFNVGQLNSGKFPLVDFQRGDTLVSLKSVDTTGTTWLGRMEDHIYDLGTNGAAINDVPARMVLDLRVQPGGAAAAQQLIEYGANSNVIVIVKEFK